MMSAIEATIMATALPSLQRALHAPINWLSWTLTIYQLGLALSMLVAGRLSDQLGSRRVFLGAAALFTAGSLACGLAPDVALLILFRLILFRLVQALGAGAFLPCAMSVVIDAFEHDGPRALGLQSGVYPLGALGGPVVGAVLITEWSWRSIFLVNVPGGLAFLVLAARFLPRNTPVGGEVDRTSCALVGGFLLCAMIAITRLGDHGVAPWSPEVAVLIAASLGCAAALVDRSHRLEHPLIPRRLLAGRPMVAINGFSFVWGACVVGFGALIPLYAEDRYGLHPLEAGTLLTFRAVGEAACAMAVSVTMRRTGYRLPMIVGCLALAAGMILIVLPPYVGGTYGWLSLTAALTGVGVGVSAPSSNNAGLQLGLVDVGASSGLRAMLCQAGAIFGVALATSMVARSGAAGASLGHSFVVVAAGVALIAPLAFLVPNRQQLPDASL